MSFIEYDSEETTNKLVLDNYHILCYIAYYFVLYKVNNIEILFGGPCTEDN